MTEIYKRFDPNKHVDDSGLYVENMKYPKVVKRMNECWSYNSGGHGGGGHAVSSGFKKLKLSVYPTVEYKVAKDDELQLDIDSEADWKHFQMMMFRFKEDLVRLGILNIKSITVKESDTPGHRHVIIKLNNQLGLKHRIFWQAVLGSDRVRELRNLCRSLLHLKDAVLLVEKEGGESYEYEQKASGHNGTDAEGKIGVGGTCGEAMQG